MKRRTFLKRSAAAAGGAYLSIVSSSAEIRTGAPTDSVKPTGLKMAGIRMIPVMGGKYKVWTKRVGSGPVKGLLLHGGPGFTHDYLEAMESFLDTPDDPTLWTLPRYLAEVEEVRQGLGLDKFVLYGHSWGGILALEYALHFQQHLSGLVIFNMTASTQSYVKLLATLKKTLLTPESLRSLNALETAKDYDNPAYSKIVMDELYPQMICRLETWPEPVTRTLRLANQKIYNQMQGKSELEVTGNLRDWDRWDRLHEVGVRTLTIGSKHDEMDPDDLRRMAKLMPNAVSAICPNGSHLDMWDDQAIYFKNLLAFLRT